MKQFLIWCVLFFFPAFALAQWESVPLPFPYDQGYYLDVFFLPANPQYGWACGFNGYVVRTTDGGRSWSGTQLPNNAYHMESIHFVSPLLGWCSGTSPDRVYRTTDGGQTWVDVTPGNAADIWGCYFVNASVGVVLGGGCGNSQYFYRTTNGGISWTETTYTEPNSGLSDAILYSPTGLGFAVSSGLLWRTTDGGVSWSVFASSGPKYWQEEITHNGNSFLLPVSGTTCYGDGPGGELRFSSNNGASWISFATGANMFGAFLLSPSHGWGVGNNGAVFRTTNAGASWELLNCGVEGVDLDDIWFVNDTTAFIAGENGLYRMVWPPVRKQPDTLLFDTLCIQDMQMDTIWLRNYWKKPYNAELSLSGSSDFSILSSPTFVVPECDSLPLIVRFAPNTEGEKIAVVTITFPEFSRTYHVLLRGYGKEDQQYTLNTDTVTINPAYCGQINSDGAFVQPSEDSVLIFAIIPVYGDTAIIHTQQTLPLRVGRAGERILFSADPPDTGWYTAAFRIVTNSCSPDTTIVVRAYGVSPIITVNETVYARSECQAIDTVAIAVRNTGNDTLRIQSVTVGGPDAARVLRVFWEKSTQFPAVIAPDSSDTLSVVVDLAQPAMMFTLSLENNDRTRTRGIANPKEVRVTVESNNPKLEVEEQSIDFGAVCLGDTKEYTVELRNVADSPVVLRTLLPVEGYALVDIDSTIVLTPHSSSSIRIRFQPTRDGEVKDSLVFIEQRCAQRIVILLNGVGVQSAVTAEPSNLNAKIPIGDTATFQIALTSVGSTTAIIEQIQLFPLLNGVVVKFESLPYPLLPGESTTITLSVVPLSEDVINGTLCVSGSAYCAWDACVDITIEPQNAVLDYAPSSVTIPPFFCQVEEIFDTIWVYNRGSAPLQVDSVVLVQSRGSVIRTMLPYNFPVNIAPQDSLPFPFSIFPQTPGEYFDTIYIYTAAGRATIPVRYEFLQSDIVLESEKYQRLDTLFVCDQSVSVEIALLNSGNLPDTVVVTVSEEAILVDPKVVPLEPTEERSFHIFIPPGEFSEGLHTFPIFLASRQCRWHDTIFVEFLIRDPQLIANPKEIQILNVRARKEQRSDTLFLLNPSSIFPVSIVSIAWDVVPDGVTIHLPDLPLLLPPQQEIGIPIEYTPQFAGEGAFGLTVQYGPVCTQELSIFCQVSSFDPIYSLVLEIPSYEAYPGDTIVVAVLAGLSDPQVDLQRLRLQIHFQPTLFTPLRVLSPTGASIPSLYDGKSGRLDVDVDTPLLEILKSVAPQKDTLGKIIGLVNLAHPPQTQFVLADPEVITTDSVEVVLVPGDLRLKEVCLLDARYIQFAPEYRILSVTEDEGQMQFVISADAEMEITIAVTSLTGEIICQQTSVLQSGENRVALNCNIGQGLYFWIVQSKWRMQFGKTVFLR